MPDNSTDDILEMLIRYMDNELLPDEKPVIEKMLRENDDVNDQYQILLAAKQAIRSENIKQRVQAVHNEFAYSKTHTENTKAKIVKPSSFFKTFMRVAAVFVIAVAGYGIFEYTTTTDQSVYSDNFINYQLPVNRGVNNNSNIDSLYQQANYTAVTKAFEAKQQKNQEDYFIAAQSYLHLDNTDKAIASFNEVKRLNENSTKKYFVDETDYYLALAYIKSGRINEAKELLNKITADKQNLFYNKAKKISSFKLKILNLKK